MFTEKVCRHQLDYDPRPCNGTVTLKLHYYFSVGLAKRIQNAVLGLSNKSKTFVFLNVGFHDQLNESLVKERLLLPLLHTMKLKRLTWPRILWAGIHKFGMMRSSLTSLNSERVREFNENLKAFLAGWEVPVFDTFNLTDNVMSFDGQHYGLGLNKMKVTILLHYLQQLRLLGQW